MIAKWNLWISNLDTVIFLGDFARVKYHEEKVGIPNAIANLMVLKWSKMWFIKGNHDTQKFLNVLVHSFCNIFVRNVLMTKYEDYVCVFIHDPANFLPVRTDEKIIVFHGHLHGEKTFAHESIKSRMRNIRYIDVSWDKLKHPVKIKDLINR
jgi:calcineurin-like phosphoesterase family protein